MENKISKIFCIMAGILILCVPVKAIYADEPAKAVEKIKEKKPGQAKAEDKEKAALKEENEKLRSERAKLYEDMGTAYTKAKLYREAIDAYSQSLIYGPNNADVHYYLGLLYQKSKKDPQKAAFHLKRYLYLKPDADNKEEVQYMIEMVLNQR